MTTNNKISTVVSSQLPEFVRSDHPTFIAFVKAYYEYLEQSNTVLSYGKTVERAKNLTKYFDTDKITDTGLTEFNDHLYNEFLTLIPKEVSSDKSKLLKNIKDFYRAKGTEKSYNFFFRLLFNEDPELYYPKNDILIASSGKWLVEQSIRLSNIEINEIVDDSIINLKKFESTKVVGNTSQASAFVERIFVSYESGTKINEFFISNKNGDFISGEQVFIKNANNETLSADILSGFISSVALTNGGSGYTIGTSIPVVGGGGSGGSVIISDVSSGNISNVSVISGGAGFRVSDFILFSGGGGAGANANVIQVLTDNSVHPNTYNINSDVINTYNLTTIGAYSNSSGGNANTALVNTLTFFAYSNTGPVVAIRVSSGGNNYTSLPTASIEANTRIKNLGIIGRLKINDGGTGYSNGATLIFTNIPGGFGYGANGNVVTNATGTIIGTNLTLLGPGHLIGGAGYSMTHLPNVSISGSGSGANIVVSALLGFGDELTSNTGSIGVIEELTITNRGVGYVTPPTLDFTNSGDGLATANVTLTVGTYTYPGRFKDDTGLLSSSNYLENRDYYQNFSYVIKVKRALNEYKQYALNYIHPAGLKLFGEYLYISEPVVDDTINVGLSNTSSYIPYVTNSIDFNGSNSILYKTEALGNTSNGSTGTISFWFRPTSFANDQTIFSISNNSNSQTSQRFSVSLTKRANTLLGKIADLVVISGGAGFRKFPNDTIVISGTGTSANATIVQVLDDGSVHPNTYNINSDVINTYNLTAIGAYSNSSGGNANTSLLTTLTYFEYANTGPIYLVALNDPGAGYNILSTTAEASGNSMIKALGIIGRLKINSAGSGYSNNAKIIFTNVVGGYGFGANAKAIVNASGSIIRTELTPYTTDSGHIVGGFGYDANAFPILSIEGAGVDANITVEALLGDGDVLAPLAYPITQNTDGDIIRITARNAANLPLLELTTNTSTLIFKNTWNHFVATWDLSSNSACKVYLNDINSTRLDLINFGQIDYTGSNVSIGSEPNLTRSYRGCLSEFWFSNNYADIANTTIRTFFIGANGVLLPSNMQASNGYMGRVNLNITPSIYLKSNGLFANTNSGIANNFTFANNITNCSNTSSEPA
jgi:hypothetical protein